MIDDKNEKPVTDYEKRAYALYLYTGQYGKNNLSEIIVKDDAGEVEPIYRCFETIDDKMMELFLGIELQKNQRLELVHNRLDYGDDGWWEREDDAGSREWGDNEDFQSHSKSLNMAIMKFFRKHQLGKL